MVSLIFLLSLPFMFIGGLIIALMWLAFVALPILLIVAIIYILFLACCKN